MPSYFDFSENRFLAVFALESLFPSSLRKTLSRILNLALLAALLPLAYALLIKLLSDSHFLGGFASLLPSPGLPFLSLKFWFGILYLLGAARLFILALDGFQNSLTFDKTGEAAAQNVARRLNFYASQLGYLLYLNPALSLAALLEVLPKLPIGERILLRLGILPEEYRKIVSSTSPRGEERALEIFTALVQKIGYEKEVTASDIVARLLDTHEPLKDFGSAKGLRPEIINHALAWVERQFGEEDLKLRWWSRESLSRIPGLAKDWAYGETYFLGKFSHDLTGEALSKEEEIVGRDREIALVEQALLKTSGANVLLVGEPGMGRHTILLGLVRMIHWGKIFPELEHKQVFELFGEEITATGKTKGRVEEILIRLFDEALGAGNIILAIDNFPEFIQSLTSLGVSPNELFSPYLESPLIHIIALADTFSFRRILEENQALLKHFERVEIREPDSEYLLEILEDKALESETRAKSKVRLTYPALQEIYDGARQYLTQGATPKRAVDLLDEAVREALGQGVFLVEPELVQRLISHKTKMPLGEIGEVERKKLLTLEKLFHERVVDQEEAIERISQAARRSRTEIRNFERPIGSFLFLGPTGVGKTETAKALAEIYFGNEETMLRFDMSEYQTKESLERLLGSFSKNEPGILASKISASPYSLVLLDEFEKSDQSVRNLFLQILDEGFFSDYRGQRINMRNTIIIATSNAGSELIWEFVRKGRELAALEEEIISYIQREKIFSPELLNRFDAVVLFKPLGEEELSIIARIMLKKLKSRLEKQNIILAITDSLARTVAQGGYNPEQGARPMQRFLQDHIEDLISKKLIRGEIKPGTEFSISEEELAQS